MTSKTRIRILNDTSQELHVKINIKGIRPTAIKVKPQEEIAVFMATDEVLFKIWNNNVVMFQDREEAEP